MKKVVKWILLVAILMGLASTSRAAYVITLAGQRVDGTDIRAKSDGEIILTTAQGTRSFLKGQYAKAVADNPADIDKAAQMVAGKQYDEAVKLLEDVALRYRFLDWDNQARAMLPKIYSQKGDFAASILAYEKLFAAAPKSKEDPEIQMGYRQALLDAKQYDKLETLLNSLIGTGTRSDSARAILMRGDIRASQGQTEQALLDYLRVALLYESEKDVQPEALFKTAEALKALRDPRAPEFSKKLVEQYPDSPYAQKAK
jgi:tetratricopeptide (TPR) repeat protein